MFKLLAPFLTLLFVCTLSCTHQPDELLPPTAPAADGESTITISEAKVWYEAQHATGTGSLRVGGNNQKKFRLESQIRWDKATKKLSRKKRDWVVVPLEADKGTTLFQGYANTAPTSLTNTSQKGFTTLTYQAFFKERGETKSFIIKILPSVDYLTRKNNNDKKDAFDGLVFCFDKDGNFVEAANYSNGKIAGFSTELVPQTINSARNGRMSGCATYSFTVNWKICVEYEGQDVCVNGSDTYTSRFCDQPSSTISEEAPYSGTGGGGDGGNNIDPDTLEILTNMIVFGPDKPLTNVLKYLKCFDQNANDSYQVTIYVDQPEANSDGVLNPTAPFHHMVGHTYIGLTQRGLYSMNINRVLGWYPQTGGSPANPNVAGALGQDDTYTGGYDVAITYPVSWNAFSNILDFIRSHATGQYDVYDNNCVDFALQAMEAGGIYLPDSFGNFPLINRGGSVPGKLGQNLRNISLPEGATRQTSYGRPQPNAGSCN